MSWKIEIDRTPYQRAAATLPPSELNAIQNQLVEVIKQLPRRLRVPLVLRYVQNVSIQEISRRIGTTEERVLNILCEALTRIRSRTAGVYIPVPEKAECGIAFVQTAEPPGGWD